MDMLRRILEMVSRGELSVDEAERRLRVLAIEEIGELAKIDVGRELRRGIPEIILAEGKDPQLLAEIAFKMLRRSGRVIISRVDWSQVEALRGKVPEDTVMEVDERARIVILRRRGREKARTGGRVGILAAGTSDILVAEEARIIAEEMGCEVTTAYDVGAAGLHRLIKPLKEMVEKDVDVLVVVAGREGALPTVVAGIVDVPVIAVPTSIGYGLGEKGVSALMAMLQSCSLGVAVVNIDGGVAAGATAALIANRVAKFRGR